MKNKTILTVKFLLSICLIFTYLFSFGHEGYDYKKKKQDSTTVATTDQSYQELNDESHGQSDNHHDQAHKIKSIKADLEDFPTLHPLVVHFPIVLLLLAALSQIAGLFVFNNELSWVTLFLIASGFIGAYVSGIYVHPHSIDLSEHAEKVLTAHETYANYTTWLGGIALLLKVASHFLFKRKLWIEIVVAVVIIAAAYSVSTAGHYGAQLIHIEGIGAMGKYLEIEGHQH